jgi:hypothetical protein
MGQMTVGHLERETLQMSRKWESGEGWNMGSSLAESEGCRTEVGAAQ